MTGARTRPDIADAEITRLLSFIAAHSGVQETTLRSPLDLEPTVTVRHSTEADVEQAFREARAAQLQWAGVPVSQRVRIIRRFHDLVLAEQAALCDVIQWENGKARTQAMDEVLDIAMVCRYYAKRAPQLLKPQPRRGAFPLVTKVREVRAPKGVVAVISPWNYPLNIGITDLVPALLAGNGVVWKPDLQTVLTALMGLDLLYRAGVPRALVQLVAVEGAVVGPMLVDRGDYIMFTGSTATGREVATRAATRLVEVGLELGGKNSCIIMADAHLPKAVDIAIRGAFASAGQLCIGTERIFVHELIADEFTAAFTAAVQQLALGSHIGWGSEMGPLISLTQLERSEAHVRDAFEKGATLLAGGRRRPDIGPLVYAPTVVANVTDDMQLCRGETFGPVCALYTWSNEDELVARVNDTGYGLSAAIVSPSTRAARTLARRLRVGAVNINEAFAPAWASIDAPMGGMEASGMGRRHGVQGLLNYTESQTLATQYLLPLAPGRFSDLQWSRLTTLALRTLKWLRFP